MASSRVSSAGSARVRQPAGDVGSRLVGCREPELCGCVCVCDVTCTVCVCDVTLLCGVLPWRCVCTRARAACWLRVPALGATPSRRPAGAERGPRRVAGGMTARDAGRACQACIGDCAYRRGPWTAATSLRPRPGRGVRAPSGRRCRNQVCCFASRHEGRGNESRTYERNIVIDIENGLRQSRDSRHASVPCGVALAALGVVGCVARAVAENGRKTRARRDGTLLVQIAFSAFRAVDCYDLRVWFLAVLAFFTC